jgi:catechol 2,3-dioxygenase-like lactoylglutathione lyase family enzyme
MITGAPPKIWAMSMPDFLIADLQQSLAFWTGVMGFRIVYCRPEREFVCPAHPDGAQMMMYPRDGDGEVARLGRPFARGVAFQACVGDAEAAGLPFHVEPRERWRQLGDRRGGQRVAGAGRLCCNGAARKQQ